MPQDQGFTVTMETLLDRQHDVKGGFRHAFDRQNQCMETAIQSLDSLNSQIKALLFTSKSSEIEALLGTDGDNIQKSLDLMRQLLEDAQEKFRKMVEDNAALAKRIDTSLHAANAEVSALRVELEDTNRRLAEIGDLPPPSDTKLANEYDEDPNNQALAKELRAVRSENSSLSNTVKSLRRELEELRTASKLANATDESKVNELKIDLIQTRQELGKARDALAALKADRKRLKAEKLDLLSQMKQLYCTLEDKESELRDFIRQYEQRMTDSTVSMKQMAMEKEACEREKWEILKKAKEATERAVLIRSELDHKEERIKQLESQLRQALDKLATIASGGAIPCSSRPPRPDSMVPPPLRSMSDTSVLSPDDLPPPYRETPPPDPPSSARSCKSGDTGYSTYTSSVSGAASGSMENMQPLAESSRSSEEMQQDGVYVTISPSNTEARLEAKKKRKSMGSWSKMFGNKARSRRSIALSDPGSNEDGSSNRMSVLSQENYSEKLELLQQAQNSPISQWRANQVLAWIEIEMNMPMYARACAENIKSGKVLLELSESELESALGIQRPLHRRKLLLAIEQRKHPDLSPSSLNQLDHTWVAHRWLPDLGLPQHTPAFERHLVDGRLLNALSRKEYEKYLGVTRKFHQVSIMHGVELLRRLGFDRETINVRRSACEDDNVDPLIWSNSRIIKWVQTIDLQEYADNLKESGVHGAVLVLEPTFTAEAMATALGIPPSKEYVRRHLATELEVLVRPARAALESASKKKSSGGSLGKAFVRSYRGGSQSPAESETSRGSAGRKLTFRGSLGRALGKKAKAELNNESSSNTRSPRGQLDQSKRSMSVELESTSV